MKLIALSRWAFPTVVLFDRYSKLPPKWQVHLSLLGPLLSNFHHFVSMRSGIAEVKITGHTCSNLTWINCGISFRDFDREEWCVWLWGSAPGASYRQTTCGCLKACWNTVSCYLGKAKINQLQLRHFIYYVIQLSLTLGGCYSST